MKSVTYDNLTKRSGRWIVDGVQTVQCATIQDVGDAVVLKDASGRMLKLVAKGLIRSVEES